MRLNKIKDKNAVVELTNGVQLPVIGFGTACMRSEGCKNAVGEAVKSGYRLIDTAAQYKNEEPVGKAAAESDIPRSKLFINSKLWNEDHGYENTMRAFEETLRWTGLEYLDSYLIHWPNPKPLRNMGFEEHNAASWKAMEELYRAGKIKAIGVSNFLPHHLNALIRHAEIKPMINQICLYPGNIQKETVAYCREHHIVLQAYSPLGAGKLLAHPVILGLSKKYGCTPAQICIRWHLQSGFIPLPKSADPARIRTNMDVFDMVLSDEDMGLLSSLDVNIKLLPNPDEADF